MCSPTRRSFQGASIRPTYDHPQYPVEVLNRAADIFRVAGHMLGERLLLFLLSGTGSRTPSRWPSRPATKPSLNPTSGT